MHCNATPNLLGKNILRDIKGQDAKYPCNECDFKGTQQAYHKQHIKSMHLWRKAIIKN